MKAYVVGYWPKIIKEENNLPSGPTTEHEVGYSKEPQWIKQLIWEAESECGILHKMRTRVGEHYCEFSVEEQPKGGFAIVCKTHPEPPE